MATHCDIGISPKVASVLAIKPTIDYLCNDYSDGGSSIRQSDVDFDWTLPAAVDCPKCIRVRDLWRGGKTLKQARKIVKSSPAQLEAGMGATKL